MWVAAVVEMNKTFIPRASVEGNHPGAGLRGCINPCLIMSPSVGAQILSNSDQSHLCPLSEHAADNRGSLAQGTSISLLTSRENCTKQIEERATRYVTL